MRDYKKVMHIEPETESEEEGIARLEAELEAVDPWISEDNSPDSIRQRAIDAFNDPPLAPPSWDDPAWSSFWDDMEGADIRMAHEEAIEENEIRFPTPTNILH